MRYVLYLPLIGCFLFLFGCGEARTNGNSMIDEGVKDLTGHIVDLTDSTMLVTGSDARDRERITATRYQIDENTILSYASGIEAALHLEVGMKVEVWNTGVVAESFPAQAVAAKVVFDDRQSPEERLAIQRALREMNPGYPWHIQRIERDDDGYVVAMKNLLSDDPAVETRVDIQQ